MAFKLRRLATKLGVPRKNRSKRPRFKRVGFHLERSSFKFFVPPQNESKPAERRKKA